MCEYTLLTSCLPRNHQQKAMPWQPRSMTAPPPDWLTSQKPISVRAGMFLTLFHEVHPAERSFISHLLRLHVLRRKEQLLGVEQQHARLAADVDHRVRFLEGHAQRLFADH